MDGRLYRVSEDKSQILMFDSDPSARFSLIFIGGLTDGFMSLPYLITLASNLKSIGWSLIQVNLSSSFAGFGVSSIDKDVLELQQVVKFIEMNNLKDEIAFMGHSTGCQDVLALMNDLNDRPTKIPILGCILQGGISDRETMDKDEQSQRLLQLSMSAENMDAPLSELMYGFVPITARRFLSLIGKMTPDDMFSTDLTPNFLDFTLRGIKGYPLLVIQGSRDEYISVDRANFKKFFQQTYKDAAIESGATHVAIRFLDGSHNLGEVVDSLVGLVLAFVRARGAVEEVDRSGLLGRWGF